MDFIRRYEIFKTTLIDKGAYVKVLTGLKNTVTIAVVGLLIGILLGTLIAVVKVLPKTNPLVKILDKIATVYVGFFRGTPIMVQLLLGYYILFPLMGLKVNSMTVCIIIFGLNSAAYVSEIMRSGIMSVDAGQMEAGRAVGFGYGRTMMRIIVPQAVKNILPTIGNEFIALIKETSVVNFVGAMDLYNAFSYIGSANYEFMIPYLAMAVIYIVMVMLITLLIKFTERRLRAGDKR